MDFEQFQQFKIKDTIINFIVPIISTLVCIGLLAGIIFPYNTKIAQLNSELETTRTLAQTLNSKVLKLRSLVDFRTSVEENNTLMNRVMPKEPFVPQLLTQIDMIAKDAGLEVTKLAYTLGDTGTDAGQETKEYQVVAITLGVNGTVDQTKAFLEGIENSGRVVNVNNIRYAEGEEGLLAYSFVLISPYVDIRKDAVTDEPITFEISDKNFQDLLAKLKQLRIYDISLDEVNVEFVTLPEESTPAGDAAENPGVVNVPSTSTPPAQDGTGSGPATPVFTPPASDFADGDTNIVQ